jgi:CRISPR-associated protein (TIGR02584 family)
LAPQIVTETLYALATDQDPPFVPNEIHIITTDDGRQRVELMLLDPSMAKLRALAEDLARPELACALDPDHIHVVTGTQGCPLRDIQSQSDNAATADLINDIVRELTADEKAALHVSIAGGRKTMGFLLGYALSLYGRPQDRLSHVLVDPLFEQHAEFFYPPKVPRVLFTRDNRPINTADADIRLADIPFVRLRHGLPQQMLAGTWSYSETVARAQERFVEPAIVIDCERRLIACHGIAVPLPPLPFALYAWLARRRLKQRGDGGAAHWTMPVADELVAEYGALPGVTANQVARLGAQMIDNRIPAEKLEQNKSRVNAKLALHLGPLAEPYEIKTLSRRPGTQYEPIGLTLDPAAIRFGPFRSDDDTLPEDD